MAASTCADLDSTLLTILPSFDLSWDQHSAGDSELGSSSKIDRFVELWCIGYV